MTPAEVKQLPVSEYMAMLRYQDEYHREQKRAMKGKR